MTGSQPHPQMSESPKVMWPLITVPVLGKRVGSWGAMPVRQGCGLDGARVGYIAGGAWPAGMKVSAAHDPEDNVAEIWVRLDPSALAEIPAVRDAVLAREAQRGDADRAEFAESCCGKCPGDTCYVDQVLGNR